MKKIFSITSIFVFAFVITAQAQEMQFPIAELGNCTDKESCKTYCDVPGNELQCLSFAEKNGLMSEEEVEMAKKFIGQTGPGGCKGQECKTYCDDDSHMNECLDFAAQQGFISSEEADMIKKFKTASENGGPGGCKGEECKTYCDAGEHQSECFEFAKTNNLLPPEEIERFEKGQKIQEKMKSEGGPGGCTDDESCHKFCSNPENIDACVNFAVSTGAYSAEDARKEVEKFRQNGSEKRLNPDNFRKLPPRNKARDWNDRRDSVREERREERRNEEGSDFHPEMMSEEDRTRYEEHQMGNQETMPDRPSEGEYPPPPPPPTESSPQSRLSQFLTASLFNSEAPFIKKLLMSK